MELAQKLEKLEEQNREVAGDDDGSNSDSD